MRQDKTRRLTNSQTSSALKKALKKAQKTASAVNLQAAYSAIDRAAKKKIIHQNHAARLKSRLAKKASGIKPTRKIRSRTTGKGVGAKQ